MNGLQQEQVVAVFAFTAPTASLTNAVKTTMLHRRGAKSNGGVRNKDMAIRNSENRRRHTELLGHKLNKTRKQ